MWIQLFASPYRTYLIMLGEDTIHLHPRDIKIYVDMLLGLLEALEKLKDSWELGTGDKIEC
jgi:hypothetical protein